MPLQASTREGWSIWSGLRAVINEDERERISERTKEALQAAKARGRKLGNPNGAAAFRRAGKGNGDAVAAIKAGADSFAEGLRGTIAELRASGAISLPKLAAGLNERHIRTPRGGQWQPSTVSSLLARLDR